MKKSHISRRSVLRGLLGGAGALAGLHNLTLAANADLARVDPKDAIKITKLETFLVKPRTLFLKVHTEPGIIGLGEPITEGKAATCATAVKELESYLIGKDARHVGYHWQAIYRHAFSRNGPILCSAISAIDMALWDIKGKALGVPVYELLGGPTRDRIRVYAGAGSPESILAAKKKGYTAFKTGVPQNRPARIVENPAFVEYFTEKFAALREAAGPECDLAIDFHGAIPPSTAKLLIKALEPYQPLFIEEPINCENHDVMAEIARGTFLPIATGERVFTKWGFRRVLEKGAASILQPDVSHAGGITEVRLIAGMAEAYYAGIAPHSAVGPINIAAMLNIAASIPNFLIGECRQLGEGYIKKPFVVEDGYVALPAGPGLGIELDEDGLADKIGHDYHIPWTYDADDNSVVDW